MSFQPVIQILQVPRSSQSFYFKDATENYPTSDTGWGAPNAPANVSEITSIYGAVQPYGKTPIKSTEVAGALQTKVELTVYVPDGVDNFWVYYGQQVIADWTISADRKTMTFSGVSLADLLDSVGLISADGEYPVNIKSISGNVVTLTDPLEGTDTAGTGIYRYWAVSQRRLVLNCIEGRIVNLISFLPISKKSCEDSQDVLDVVLLKLAAETAYNCGNFTRAQEAADLGCADKTVGSTNCYTCG